MSATDFAAPVVVPLPLRGGAVEVAPMNVRQIARLLRASVDPVSLLLAVPPDALDRLSDGQADANDLVRMYEALSRDPELLLELVAIASGLEAARVDALLPDELALLFATVVQVNADFFSRATPVFGAAGATLRALKPASTATASGPEPSTR